MNVGWVQDWMSQGLGGAELTAAEFRAACPNDTTTYSVSPDYLNPLSHVDAVVIQNCVSFDHSLIESLGRGAPVIKYVHDLMRDTPDDITDWLIHHALLVFPSQKARTDFLLYHSLSDDLEVDNTVIPPAINTGRWLTSAERSGTGNIWIGRLEYAKGIVDSTVWAWFRDETLHVYGIGGALDYVKNHPRTIYHQPVDYGDVPNLLSQYEAFVFHPTERETFSRTTYEAWLAGLKLHIREEFIGCTEYMNAEGFARVQHAGEDFWNYVKAAK